VKIVFISTGLNLGGGERVLVDLMNSLVTHDIRVSLVLLAPLKKGNNCYHLLNQEKITVYQLNYTKNPLLFPLMLIKIRQILKKEDPDLVQGWLYHGSIFASIATLLHIKKIPVFWSIHHADVRMKSLNLSTYLLVKFMRYLSHIMPKKIIFCSKNALESHVTSGFSCTKSLYITNGVNSELFVPSLNDRVELRSNLNIIDDVFLVGLVGRFHQDKGCEDFIKAATIVLKRLGLPVKFLMCGPLISSSNKELIKMLTDHGILESCILISGVQPVSKVMNAIDLLCLTSKTESFGLVLAEAMLCATPCVSTDVGAAREILADYGSVTPVGDFAALAQSVIDMLKKTKAERDLLGQKGRAHVCNNFSFAKFSNQYIDLYENSLSSHRTL